MVTPYEQARWYADYITPRSVAPKYILTCNFDEIRIYDTDEEYPERTFETIHLEELPNLLHRLSFFTQKENSRAERETNLSVSAGEVVGKLYDAFSKSYLDIENNEDEQRSLNMLITRIVFLLYAEDSGNLKVRNQFYNYMSNYQTAHMRNALRDLFLVLNTEEDKRDPYLPEELADYYISCIGEKNGPDNLQDIKITDSGKNLVATIHYNGTGSFEPGENTLVQFKWAPLVKPTQGGARRR